MIRETPRQAPLLKGQVAMDIPRFEVSIGQLELRATISSHVRYYDLMRMRSLRTGDTNQQLLTTN
jgi:hypothetical protein